MQVMLDTTLFFILYSHFQSFSQVSLLNWKAGEGFSKKLISLPGGIFKQQLDVVQPSKIALVQAALFQSDMNQRKTHQKMI